MNLLGYLRTFGVESVVGRSVYAGAQLVRSPFLGDPYRRTSAVLKAWRATSHPAVVWTATRHLDRTLRPEGALEPLARNPLLRSFVDGAVARRIRRRFAGFSLEHRVRLRLPRPPEDPARQGNLIVLKRRDVATGEKGVLLIKYTEEFERLAAVYEVERLVEEYMLVLEPSWWGYQDVSLFMYAGSDSDVLVQAQTRPDYEFLAEYAPGLTPVRLGAGDWIDPSVFGPSDHPRRYDIVMVSSWNPFKRHTDLFAAIRDARDAHGRTLMAALIGYPSGWTVDDIERMLEQRGIRDQCELFNAIPQTRVAEIVARARVYVLLSRREGANKAMYEAMFCDTPVLAPKDHKGINHADLNEQTGSAFARDRLTEALLDAVDRSASFSPRRWALENTGYENATRSLNAALRRMADSAGAPWNTDIVAKKNAPNLRYPREEDRLAMEPEYDRLVEFLRPELRPAS